METPNKKHQNAYTNPVYYAMQEHTHGDTVNNNNAHLYKENMNIGSLPC